MDQQTRERLTDDLRALVASEPDQHLFAILDTARSVDVYTALEGTKARRASLLGIDVPEELLRSSPYLVEARLGGPLLDRFLERGWADSWGVLLTSTYELDFLIDHLRSIVHARTEEGGKYFFRFYDPRVIRLYLPTCTPRELDDFFGPVKRFLVEGQPGEPDVIEYVVRDGALVRSAFEVERAPAGS
jgi:hypothetical protein